MRDECRTCKVSGTCCPSDDEPYEPINEFSELAKALNELKVEIIEVFKPLEKALTRFEKVLNKIKREELIC